jgi:hypothetical protein
LRASAYEDDAERLLGELNLQIVGVDLDSESALSVYSAHSAAPCSLVRLGWLLCRGTVAPTDFTSLDNSLHPRLMMFNILFCGGASPFR